MLTTKELLDLTYKTIEESRIRDDLCLIGAYNLNLYLEKENISNKDVNRGTTDLDFDCSNILAKNYILNEFIRDLKGKGLEFEYTKVDRRNFFSLKIDVNGIKIGIDCNMRSVTELNQGLAYMLCNKFSSISSDQIVRRTKDIYDLFIIAKYLLKQELSYKDILIEMKSRGRKLGKFKYFKSQEGLNILKSGMEKYNPKPVLTYSVDEVLMFVLEESFRLEEVNDRERILEKEF